MSSEESKVESEIGKLTDAALKRTEEAESPPDQRRWNIDSYQDMNISRRTLGDDEVKLIEENDEYVNEKLIQVRSESEILPMTSRQRKVAEVMGFFDSMLHLDKKEEKFENDEEMDVEDRKQYTLTTKRKMKGTPLQAFLSCLGLHQSEYGGNKPTDRSLIAYLHWTFNASFFTLFASFLGIFMALILVFAGFIQFAGTLKPSCITPNAITGTYADSFALSWTTFSTVGYGNVYPSLASQIPEQDLCVFITFITSLESFVGVLYAGFCGAIIFGKVLRILNQAQVVFTDPMLIKFGRGSKEVTGLETKDWEQNDIPCPVLEFRIYNRDYDKVGAEIINASLSCLAIKAETKEESTKKSTIKNARRRTVDVRDVTYAYYDLELEKNQHPFFKRIWIARHTLNEESPILAPWARDMIKKNEGRWPEEFSNAEGVRKALRFDQIIANLSGTSSFSAASVYAQKIYDDFDITIGYEFVNTIYKDSITNRMMIDMNMINDVKEQEGGGGELLVEQDS